jgi:hypothetical protein
MRVVNFVVFCVIFSLVGITAQAKSPLPFKKVLVIVLENTDYQVALKQPFLARLIQQGAVFKNFSSETHPSLPNYIAMISGDTMGIRDDDDYVLKVDHLGNLLEKKGLTWKNYAEDYPGNCFQGSTHALFARKHVPFLSFQNVLNNPQECANVVNSSQFQKDVDAATLPTFSMYVPNLNNDGHDTDTAFADRWLKKEFGEKLTDPGFLKNLLVVITFDESLDYRGPNQILTIFLGSGVQPGSVVTSPTNHYDVLRTIEDNFGLGNLGRGDAKAKSITGIWK